MAVYVDPEGGIAYPGEGGPAGAGSQSTGSGDDFFAANAPPAAQGAPVGREQLEQMARAAGVTPDPSDMDVLLSGRLSGDEALQWYQGRLQARAGTPSGPRAGGSENGAFGKGFDVPAFGETYNALQRPSYLQGPYQPPTWTGGDFVAPAEPDALKTPFTAPTQAELEGSPGYLSMLGATQRGLERSAAAKGSVLSGGFVGQALPRALNEASSYAYGNLFSQKLAGRQQQAGEYQAAVGNAFDTYKQKYGQFSDARSADVGARQQNENAFQSDQAANTNQFNTRYQMYLDAIKNQRDARNDYFGQNLDWARLGLDATTAGAPR